MLLVFVEILAQSSHSPRLIILFLINVVRIRLKVAFIFFVSISFNSFSAWMLRQTLRNRYDFKAFDLFPITQNLTCVLTRLTGNNIRWFTSSYKIGSCRYNNHLKNHPKQQQQFLLRNLQKQELEQENGGQYLESGSNSSPLQYRRSCHDSDRSQTHVFQSSLVRQHCPTSNCAESHM